MGDLLIKNGFLAGPNAPYMKTDILIENGKISGIGKFEEKEGVKCIDAEGKVVLPGFVNCHHHLYSALARGIPIGPGTQLNNFDNILKNLWWKLDVALNKEDIYYSAMAGILDSVKNGVTTIVDHHASFGLIEGSLDIIEDAMVENGVRGVLCYEVSDRHGEAATLESINENKRFLKKVNDKDYAYKDSIGALFGLHAAFTCSDKTLERCVVANTDFSTGFHIHLSEDLMDVNLSMKNHGKRVVPRLLERGILEKNTLCVHGVHIDNREIEILNEKNCYLAYNPMSNMNNAVGVPPILDMISAGVKVVQGTDGFTSSLLENFKYAFLLQKITKMDPGAFTYGDIDNYFFNNPSILFNQFFGKNTLETGSVGDVLILDYYPPTPLTEANMTGHLIFGFSQRKPEVVVINGEVVVKDGKNCKVCEKEIAEKSSEVASKLWKRW
ncbi:putative aminohydrolase SsnA [bacterium]|nr:putative aminohydrolase SsnA [bacterium]